MTHTDSEPRYTFNYTVNWPAENDSKLVQCAKGALGLVLLALALPALLFGTLAIISFLLLLVPPFVGCLLLWKIWPGFFGLSKHVMP